MANTTTTTVTMDNDDIDHTRSSVQGCRCNPQDENSTIFWGLNLGEIVCTLIVTCLRGWWPKKVIRILGSSSDRGEVPKVYSSTFFQVQPWLRVWVHPAAEVLSMPMTLTLIQKCYHIMASTTHDDTFSSLTIVMKLGPNVWHKIRENVTVTGLWCLIAFLVWRLKSGPVKCKPQAVYVYNVANAL